MALETLKAYATPDDLVAVIGGPADTSRLAVALVTASEWVALRVGEALLNPDMAPVGPYVIESVSCPAQWRAATIAAAVRFYKGPDVPFGLAGTDLTAYVRSTMPEVDLALLGQRTDFGVG